VEGGWPRVRFSNKFSTDCLLGSVTLDQEVESSLLLVMLGGWAGGTGFFFTEPEDER